MDLAEEVSRKEQRAGPEEPCIGRILLQYPGSYGLEQPEMIGMVSSMARKVYRRSIDEVEQMRRLGRHHEVVRVVHPSVEHEPAEMFQ